MAMRRRVEFIPGDRAIFQSERAKSYRCPTCLRWVLTQYEGDAPLMPDGVVCHGDFGQRMEGNTPIPVYMPGGHTLTWEEE